MVLQKVALVLAVGVVVVAAAALEGSGVAVAVVAGAGPASRAAGEAAAAAAMRRARRLQALVVVVVVVVVVGPQQAGSCAGGLLRACGKTGPSIPAHSQSLTRLSERRRQKKDNRLGYALFVDIHNSKNKKKQQR